MNPTSTAAKLTNSCHDSALHGSGHHDDGRSVSERLPNSAGAQNASDTPDTTSTQSLMTTVYGPIVDPLNRVEELLRDQLQPPHPELAELLQHGTQLGGKRLRPAILLLVGAATGQISDEHVTLGTVVEMVHTATLIHDDVLDHADSRRHVPTVNAIWNDHTSILLGDFLFAQSFRLAATLTSTRACRLVGEASRLVCEGELRQVLHRDALELTEEAYLGIIRGKTAELCRVACELGAIHSCADEATVSAMATYGDAVGIAFQIADDFLDVWGDDGTVGKTLGTDLEQGKMTLPLIRLRDQADPAERQRLMAALNGPSAERMDIVRPMLAGSDAAQYTRLKAESFRKIAVEALDVLPESTAKESLKMIADFSIRRRF